jgi:putative transposase
VVTPAGRRAVVEYLVKERLVSQRHACGLVGVARGTVRYSHKRDAEGAGLGERMRELALEHPHYGFRTVQALLRREGVEDNHKRLHRIWKLEGLSIRRRMRRHRAIPSMEVVNKALYANHVWTYDFIEDKTTRGTKVRILNILDEYTREHLWAIVDTSIKALQVTAALEWLFSTRGVPEYIRSDNGSEFIADVVRGWLGVNKVKTIYIEPGSPWQNPYVESFHDKMRKECLNANEFDTVVEARAVVWQWLEEYNEYRPHSSLGYKTPREFAAETSRSPRPTASATLKSDGQDVVPTLAVV